MKWHFKKRIKTVLIIKKIVIFNLLQFFPLFLFLYNTKQLELQLNLNSDGLDSQCLNNIMLLISSHANLPTM